MIQKLAQYTDIRVALVVGGLSLQVQATTLRSRPEVIIATPVRMSNKTRGSLHSTGGNVLQSSPVAVVTHLRAENISKEERAAFFIM